MQIATPPTSAAQVMQVHDLRGDQRREPCAEAGPLAHEVEDRPLGDRGHAAAHLRVDDDPDDADHDDPQELVAEGGAGLRVEDEVADVDEAADRREDPERDARKFFMFTRAPSLPLELAAPGAAARRSKRGRAASARR